MFYFADDGHVYMRVHDLNLLPIGLHLFISVEHEHEENLHSVGLRLKNSIFIYRIIYSDIERIIIILTACTVAFPYIFVIGT